MSETLIKWVIAMNQLGLGYLYLNPDEKYAYDSLLRALSNHRTSCDISTVKRTVDILKVMSIVMGDNPNIIYFDKTLLRTMSGLFVKQISFAGCVPSNQAKKKEEQLKKALDDAAWEIDKEAHNDKEILQGITEYLQRNVVYDYDEYSSNMKMIARTKFPDAHNAYGALVNHRAVCDGFSSAYALIAQYFGFRCMLAQGKSSYNRGGKVNHAWNIVEYENKFYHIDTTWDANTYAVSKRYSYIYFGLDDDEIMLDHDWDCHYTPICNANKLSYFWSNGLVAQSESQIESIIVRELKKGKTDVNIRISVEIRIDSNSNQYWIRILPGIMGKAGIMKAFQYIWNEHARCLAIYIN